MIFTIHKDTHRAKPLRFGLWFNKRTITKDVMFFDDCAYYLPGIDQLDTNKLFGIGYLWSHHKDSARFGWRYNSEKNKIVLSAYAYVSGNRVIIDLAEIPFGKYVRCTIKVDYGKYVFYVDGFETRYIEFAHKKKIGFPLGVYFGGNKLAPSTMHIDFK
jgi:hypothetical protein